MPATWTPERRAARSEAMRRRWADPTLGPALRQRIVASAAHHATRWTDAEERVLRTQAGRVPFWRLVELVNLVSRRERTPGAVRLRLSQRQLSAYTMGDWLTTDQVGAKLSRRGETIRLWVRAGKLPATPGGSGRPSRGNALLIDPADVLALLKAEPWLVDPESIRDATWRSTVEVERRVRLRLPETALPVQTVMARTGLTRWAITNAIRAGELPATRQHGTTGRHAYRYLIDPADLHAWLQQRRGSRGRAA